MEKMEHMGVLNARVQLRVTVYLFMPDVVSLSHV